MLEILPITETNNHQINGKQNGQLFTRKQQVETAVRAILAAVGEDPDRQGLQGTPDRIARMYEEILSGYSADLATIVNGALFDVAYADIVLVKDIDFYSMCEHHMLPFWGRAHVAYVPSDKVIGLSKIPRIVEMFARRLQVQERMTRQIAEAIIEVLQPQGVAVFVEGTHMCAAMRGVKKPNTKMATRYLNGVFETERVWRDALLQQLG
ncbi:MAG: GTP cyclohydrolase I FolE [Chloroflexi bacterium]|nr:MAG: GTP cyclohydrolase I FolE [Chloroflexota bacterium]